MTSKRLFGWLAVGALLLMIAGPLSSFAYAEEQPRWTGVYGGVNLGFGLDNADTRVRPLPTAAIFVNLAPTMLHPDPSGVIGGWQFGYNSQSGHLVLGAEFDFSLAGIDGTKTLSPIIQNNGTPFPGPGNNITVHQDTSWLSTVRGRIGGTLGPKLLIYGTGGLAIGHVNYAANTDFRPVGTEQYPAALDKTKTGWVAGGGAEIAMSKRWSVKGEFLHYDLGGEPITANPVPPLPPFQIAYDWETSGNVVRGGLNFKF